MRRVVINLLLITTILVVSGCATYKYERVAADGSSCSISTSSMRDFEGLAFGVDENCAIKSKADTVDSTTAVMQVMAGLIRLIPPVDTGIAP